MTKKMNKDTMSSLSRTTQNYLYPNTSMRQLFSDTGTISCWVRVEAALAKVQARLGVIPRQAAKEIRQKAHIEYFDMERITNGKLRTGHPFVPVIDEFSRICTNDAGQYIHWGATTQDIMDTGLMLQLQAGLDLFESSVCQLANSLAERAEEHRTTLTMGRTNGQYALPMTLGARIIRWVAELDRLHQRISETRTNVQVGQFSGGIGTLASLGDKGPAIRDAFLDELDLKVPDTSWHSNRDRLSEVVQLLGTVSETVEKIAEALFMFLRPEFSEVIEHQPETRVGSSTMPQKRNPFGVMEASGLARLATGTAAQWLSLPPVADERDAKSLLLEAELVPRIFIESDAAVKRLLSTLRSLEFDSTVMDKRVRGTEGTILAERVMMRLAEETGRQNAHGLVHRLALQAYDQGSAFGEVVSADEQVRQYLTQDELDVLLEPNSYIGQSIVEVDEYLANRGKCQT